MAAKVLKLAVLPAALGLASFRVHFRTEENSAEISPRELSIYSAAPPVMGYTVEKQGRLETGLGLVRLGLRSYVQAAQDSYESVTTGALSLYQAGQDTYSFLRDPPPGFRLRVGLISVSGLAGVVLARKGSRLKRIGLPVVLASASAAVCYPTQTVSVLKITGTKVYATGSLVATALKSEPRNAAVEPAPTREEVLLMCTPNTQQPTPTTSCFEIIPAPMETDTIAPVPTSEPGVSQSVDAVQETAFKGVAPDAPGPVGLAVDPFAAPPEDAVVTTPLDDPMETITCAPAPATDVPPEPVSQFAELPHGGSAPSVQPVPTEEGAAPQMPQSVSAEEAKPWPPLTEKQRFVPDPSLADHGQASPEDADMYSTRG